MLKSLFMLMHQPIYCNLYKIDILFAYNTILTKIWFRIAHAADENSSLLTPSTREYIHFIGSDDHIQYFIVFLHWNVRH
jgi:hypothetical protein